MDKLYLILCLRENENFHVEAFKDLDDAKNRLQWMIDLFFDDYPMGEEDARYMLDECEYEIYDQRDDSQYCWGYATFRKDDWFSGIRLIEIEQDPNGRTWGCK